MQTARATSLVMVPAAWSVLVPLRLASLLTGLGSARAPRGGLFRHDWMLINLLLNVIEGVRDALGDSADPAPWTRATGRADAVSQQRQ